MKIAYCVVCDTSYDREQPHHCQPLGSRGDRCDFCRARLDLSTGACPSLGCAVAREKATQQQRIALEEAVARIHTGVDPGEPEAPAPVELRAVANEPDAEVVKQIESLLARAKSGEVRAVALANVNADGSCGTAWAGDRWAALLGISFEMLCRLREEGKPAERES